MKFLDEAPEMQQIVMECQDELLDSRKYPGVTGIDIGRKRVRGREIDELAIRVYVEQKRDDIPASQRIRPELFDGLPTDVIERRFVIPPAGIDGSPIQCTGDLRLKGGAAIAPHGKEFVTRSGALGVIVKDRDSSQLMGLTCAHPLYALKENTPILWVKSLEPALSGRGGISPEVIGTFHRFRKNCRGGKQSNLRLDEKMDAAVIPLNPRDAYPSEITGIGRFRGAGFATPGMRVHKFGPATGLTSGIVDSIDLVIKVDYQGEERRFTNQIGIVADSTQKPVFTGRGDSGSVAINNAQQAVGLCFAASEDGTYSVASPIGTVLDSLNVDLHEEPLYGLAREIDRSMSQIAWLSGISDALLRARPEAVIPAGKLVFVLTDGNCNDC
jgi:hypothetical protein